MKSFVLFALNSDVLNGEFVKKKIKLHAQISIFKHIEKRHGQDICPTRKLGNLIIRQAKIPLDIKFTKTCKKEQFIKS